MTKIDPRHLLQFHEIIRTGSFTRAAKTLGLTQPALTRNMKVMEGRLGFEVLVRSRQRVVPTTIGFRILEEAESVVMAGRRINELTDNLGEAGTQILRIGCTASASGSIMAEPLRQFARQMPTTRFEVQSAPVPALVSQLASRKIELAFGPTEMAEQLPNALVREFFHTQMMIIATHRHPLARRASLSPSDMRNQQWALYQPGTHIRLLSDKILEKMGLGGDKAAITSLPPDLIMPFLEMGDHMGIVPHYTLAKTGGRFLRIRPAETTFAFGAIWRGDSELSPQATRFIHLMNALTRGL